MVREIYPNFLRDRSNCSLHTLNQLNKKKVSINPDSLDVEVRVSFTIATGVSTDWNAANFMHVDRRHDKNHNQSPPQVFKLEMRRMRNEQTNHFWPSRNLQEYITLHQSIIFFVVPSTDDSNVTTLFLFRKQSETQTKTREPRGMRKQFNKKFFIP